MVKDVLVGLDSNRVVQAGCWIDAITQKEIAEWRKSGYKIELVEGGATLGAALPDVRANERKQIYTFMNDLKQHGHLNRTTIEYVMERLQKGEAVK